MADLGRWFSPALFAALFMAAASLVAAHAAGALEITTLWSYPIDGGVVPTAAVADLSDDEGLETVVGGAWTVYAFRSSGSILWTYPTGSGYNIVSPPTVADIDNDDELEIVASTAERVFALDHEGNERWSFPFPTVGSIQNTISSPAAADLNGDEKLEILVGDYGGVLHVLDPESGLEEWNFSTGYIIGASPTVCDLEGDGALEILIPSFDRYLHCLDAEGHELWSFYTPGSGITGWMISTPAAGDVSGDEHLEVAASSNYHSIYLLDSEGVPVWQDSRYGYATASPGIGDIDGQGGREVVVGYGSLLIAYGAEGEELWTFDVGAGYDVISAPALADLDGDGELEAIIGDIDADQPNDPTRKAWIVSSSGEELWSMELGGVPGAPVVADINDDGRMEIMVGTRAGHIFYVFQADAVLPETGLIEWGMFHHDHWHTGLHGFEISTSPVEVTLSPESTTLSPGDTLEIEVGLTNRTNEGQTFGFGTMVMLPGSVPYGPVVGPLELTLPPSGAISGHLTHVIPPAAPAGEYRYRALVGTSLEEIWDEDEFSFTVTP